MEIIDRSKKSKIINGTLGLTILAAGLIYIFILVWHSSQLSGGVTSQTLEKGNFGPISLFELSKQPLSAGGYQATIRFFQGSVTYAVLWAAAGLFVAYWRLKNTRKHK